MKDINDYEVEISLSDILLHCLNHWKSILIVVLAGVMLYSAYTYFAGRNVKSPNYTASEILSAERSTELLSDRVAYLEKFHKESNLMRIDPHKLYQATVSYIITLPQDEWEGVSNLLYTFVTYGKLLRQLEEKQDRYTAIELSHLIGIVDQQENEHISTLALTASVSKSISISMYDATEEDAEQMLALVSDEFTKYVNELKNYYTIEAIAIITPVICEADSSELAAYQKYMKTELENEQTDYKKSITALEEMRTQESTAIFSFKQILIISFTCGGLMIFLWCLVYVFGGKLYSVADLQTKYGIKLLGNINQSANKGIAKWCIRREGSRTVCPAGC